VNKTGGKGEIGEKGKKAEIVSQRGKAKRKAPKTYTLRITKRRVSGVLEGE